MIEEQGGVGFNAGTAHDYTIYFYSLPSNKVELWFLLSSEFFKHPVFREFYKERDVVLEERRMRVESSPQGRLMEKFLQTAFPDMPYGEMTGPAKEISALRAKDARQFFNKYYAPGNVTVAIVGDVNPADVKKLAQKYFGTIPDRPVPEELTDPADDQKKEHRVTMVSDSQPMIFIGYKRPDQESKDDAVFDVVAGILSSGRTGLLYKELVRDKKIALAVQAGATFPSGKLPNLFVLFGLPNSGHTVEEVEKGIYGVLDQLKNEKVDAATLERVKTKVRAGLIRQLDSNAGLAQQLPFYEVNYGDWRMMFNGPDLIEKVTAEDVQRVAREYFVPERRTVAYTVAEKGAAK
jgi:predicted Zn-dependent peptidase